MLVLTRKKGENVIIKVGHLKIEVQVIEIRGNKARLGFIAPEEAVINRQEVHERIRAA